MTDVNGSNAAAADAKATTQAVEFVVASRLPRGRNPEQVAGLIRKIDMIVDTHISEAHRRQMPPQPIACRPGCDHCCHRVVFSTALEALDAAMFIEQNLNASQQARLNDRLQTYFAKVGPNMGKDLITLRLPCPMLENGLCTIYPVRPIECRGQFSPSVESCVESRHDRSKRFPVWEAASRIATAAQIGLAGGLNGFGIWWQSIDFARAVGLALSTEGIFFHYMSGLSMFEIAAPVVEMPAPAPKPGTGLARYGRGDEPTGMADHSVLDRPRHLLRNLGDAHSGLARQEGDGPLKQVFRMQVPMAYETTEDIDFWRAKLIEAFDEFASNPADLRHKFDAISAYNAVPLSYQQRDDRDLLSRIGDYFTHEIAAKVLPDLCEPILAKRQGKLRVGYISVRLGHTSGSYWATGWLKNHGDEIETYAFNVGPKLIPGSEEFERIAHHFFHCPGPVPEVARFIKAQKLDVLIYTDAMAEGRTMQFASLRLAPMQCASWGDPETLGMPNIDTMLSSDWMEPENGQDHYREKLVRLPGTGICYPRPDRFGTGWTKAHFGLDDGPLYLCTQTPAKLLPQWDYVFKEICDRTNRPIVFFAYSGTAAAVAERRLKAAGVRALFMPCLHARQFYDIIGLADATLDSIGWSGGITTLLALQQKRPVITLPGEYRRGRQSLGLLRAASSPGLVAESPEAYIELAANIYQVQELKSTIHPEPLFDDLAGIRALNDYLLTR